MKHDHPHFTLARTLWSAVADGDAEALGLLLGEDVIWRAIGRNPLAGIYHGPDEVLDYLARIGEAADEFSSSLENIYASDEGAVLVYHVSATRRGKSLETEFITRLTVRNAVVVEALQVPVEQRENDEFWS
jgi:ketosteroid isomerase-like protein